MNCCEGVGFLQTIGGWSIGFINGMRYNMMIVSTFLHVLTWILLCVAMAGGSTEKDNIKSACWTYGIIDDDIKSYLGLKASVGAGQVVKYANCGGYCNDCETGGSNALNSTVLAWLISIVLIICSAMRLNESGDKILWKCTAFFGTLLALFIMIIGMGSWNNQCVENLPTGGGIDYQLGPGLSSSVAAFIFMLIAVVLHVGIAVGGSSSDDSSSNPEVNSNTV
eukprot:TRINITY_DN4095_c0_g1_i1.p1 TRINITY_DN4095_c0_g1~~TRINITY_DN4095_c0_g1_i1.p1  ORF type:complete len:223 (-),score=21.60 TRINITY_DN4095_c0_g1_i1:137-805(-)